MSQVALQRDFRWSQLYLCYSSSYIPVYMYTWEVLCTCIRKGLALSRSGTLNTQEEADSKGQFYSEENLLQRNHFHSMKYYLA